MSEILPVLINLRSVERTSIGQVFRALFSLMPKIVTVLDLFSHSNKATQWIALLAFSPSRLFKKSSLS